MQVNMIVSSLLGIIIILKIFESTKLSQTQRVENFWLNQSQSSTNNLVTPSQGTDGGLLQAESQRSPPFDHRFRQEDSKIVTINTKSNDFSNIRAVSQYKSPADESLQVTQRKKDKLLFRIGLIVPKTAFSSQYKIYTQRIKDHLLQLSRHHQTHHDRMGQGLGIGSSSGVVGASSSKAKSFISPSSSQQNFDNTGKNSAIASSSSSSCHTNTGQPVRLPWQDLTFNQHFDIRVVDLVSFAPRSSAHDIIESMCQKLIEQNVSVIVYLENNQDQTVTSSLDIQSFIQPSTPLIVKLQTKPSIRNHEANTTLSSKSNGRDTYAGAKTSRQLEGVQPLDSPLTTMNSNGLVKTSSQAHFIMHLAHSAGIPMIAWSVTAAQAQRPKKQKTLHLAPCNNRNR